MNAPGLPVRRWLLMAAVVIVGSPCVPLVAQPGPPAYSVNRILVKPKPGQSLSALHASLGAQALRAYPAIQNLEVVQLPPLADPRVFIDLYQRSGLVDYAEPDFVLYSLRSPNDPHFLNGNLWGLHNTGQNGGVADADIDAPAAWDLGTDASGIVVAVIDTGVRHTHEDLAANLWINPGESGTDFLGLNKRSNLLDDDGNGYTDDAHGIDAITGTGYPVDDHGHGTHVAGTVGAAGDNGRGVVGVAWRARLMHLKFLNAAGQGTTSDAIECIDYARRKGAKIISASWGGYDFNSNALRDAIASTRDAGMLFVAATGNDGTDNDQRPLFPASYDLDNVIAVAATARTDGLAEFSNYGATTVDLGAPGVDILSARNTADNAYTYMSGTSMATPHVAGACALVWARYPGESHLQIKNRVLAGTDPLPALAGKSVTGGRLNLHQALGGSAPQPTTPVVTVAATDPSAAEANSDPGSFSVTRSGSVASSLTVQLAPGGTAVNGTDYQTLPNSVTLPAGASTTTIHVRPVDDDAMEGNETVVLTLRTAASYRTGSPGSAVITIADNDTALLPPLFGGLFSLGSNPEELQPAVDLGEEHSTIRMFGAPSASYVLEASSDLFHWLSVATNRSDAVGQLLFADAQATQYAQRFYRARRHNRNLLGAPYRMDRVLVKPRSGVALADLSALNASLGVTTLAAFPRIGNLRIVNPPGHLTAASLVALYRQSGLVQYAEHDHFVHGLATPSDPRYQDGSLWGLHNTGQSDGVPDADIDAPEAWDSLTDAGGVVVAVIDTGIRLTHEDLAPNLWVNPGETPGNGLDDDNNGFVDDVHGISTLSGDGDANDDHGHGTHVAGTIGAVGNNQVGIAGVSWRVQLMALKFLDGQAEGSISDAIACINYAIVQGADVINASWGGPGFESQALRDAVAGARDAGLLFVAAAGNSRGDNDQVPLYPASYDVENVIAVAATTRTDELAGFSNFGANTVHLAAPGSPVLSAWSNSDSDYQYLDGTSMSAAHVSGVAALIKAAQPGATFAELKARILNGVDPLPSLSGRSITGGRLNAAQALGSGSDEPVVTLSAYDPEASESGPNQGFIRFHRTGDPSQPLQVNWTFSGTAQNGADFQELPTTSPFPDGSPEGDLTITPIDDAEEEEPETVVVTLVDGPGYRVGSPNTATVTIADNDGSQPSLPTVTVTATDAAASEEGDPGTFTISRTGNAANALTVDYTLGGEAVNGVDYQELAGSATIAAGSSSTAVTLAPVGDGETEDSESVVLTLSASSSYTIGSPASATVSIADEGEPPAEPVISLAGLDVDAAEAGSDPGIIRFQRTGDPDEPIEVVNWTFGGTAQNGIDFQELPTSDRFPPGLSEANLTITPNDDSEVEGSETVVVTLVDGPGYQVGTPNTATITIADNDETPPPLPTITVAATDANAAEPSNNGVFTISRTGNTSGALTVSYTMNGSAGNGSDYQELSGAVTIPNGATTATITLQPIDDAAVEDNETAVLTLAASSAYTVGSPGSATVTLSDDDEEPPPPLPTVTVAATDSNAAEPSNNGVFTISRTGNISGALAVSYTMNGSAGNGSDYQELSGAVTIPNGANSATVLLRTIDDSVDEEYETAVLRILASPAYSVGSPSSATVAIADNDEPPPPPLVADFTSSPLLGLVPLVVNFTDRSTGGPTSWTWNFGDGNSSSARNPSHVYLIPGEYTVTLTVRNAVGAISSKSAVVRATVLPLPLGESGTTTE